MLVLDIVNTTTNTTSITPVITATSSEPTTTIGSGVGSVYIIPRGEGKSRRFHVRYKLSDRKAHYAGSIPDSLGRNPAQAVDLGSDRGRSRQGHPQDHPGAGDEPDHRHRGGQALAQLSHRHLAVHEAHPRRLAATPRKVDRRHRGR